MQLTGKQIVKNNIITNYCEEGIQQQGLDVRIADVKATRGFGYVPKEGKTVPLSTMNVNTVFRDGKEGWSLSPGYYEITLMEACKIPNNMKLDYKTRSSLVRCGAIVYSGQFDAGFETDAMGCFLDVKTTIFIEKGTRIAQAIVQESYPVDEEDLYNGQWQGDKQREK